MSFVPPPPPPPINPNDEHSGYLNYMVIAHIGTLINLVSGGLGFLVPLNIMLTKGKESSAVRREAAESLNFQISLIIYALISIPLVFVIVGFFTLTAILIVSIVMPIIAASKVSAGDAYHYPLTIRFVK